MTKDSNVEKIKALITEKGVTKSKIAERCGIESSTLSKILSQKIDYVSADRIKRIIDYLDRVNTNDV